MKLYHYTTLSALKSILKEDTFYLSLFENANDYKEKSTLLEDKIKKYKYISFTKNKSLSIYSYTNSPLWYFYADKGNGVCICFDSDKLTNTITPIKEGFVKYRNGVTHIDNQDILDFLMEKRKDWKFESEYRMIFNASCTSIKSIKDCIETIYFGPETKDSQIDCAIQKIQDSINIKKMYLDKRDGRLLYYDYRQKQALANTIIRK